jgi:hypothetical protein
LPAATSGGWRTRIEAHDQQEIDGLDRTIGVAHSNGSAWWSLSQKLGMVDRQNSTVSQIDVEWLEWPGFMQSTKLLDRHIGSLTASELWLKGQAMHWPKRTQSNRTRPLRGGRGGRHF